MKAFKPTRLMIKSHAATGLKYFCKTTRENFLEYKGSGVVWTRHLNKHGKEFVITEWYSQPFTNPDDIKEFALLFSELHNIVESDKWANLKPEDGLEGGGDGYGKSGSKKIKSTINDPKWKETTGKIKVEKMLATKNNPVWQATKGLELGANISAALKGRIRDPEHCRKLSEAHKARGGTKDRIVKPETREKLRAANLGRKLSEESIKKMSESIKAAYAKHKELHGPRKNSEETKRKRAESVKAFYRKKREASREA